MGCTPKDPKEPIQTRNYSCNATEKPGYPVNLTKGFWFSQTEVTQAAYQRVTGTNPSHFKGARLPVEEVSWNDAQAYCRAIGGRLPTEAEWEYAARGGTTGASYAEQDRIAWLSGNSGDTTHEVGRKEANPWGLNDMLGNVWEWVEDRFDALYYYTVESIVDPKGPASEKYNTRVVRGGGWDTDAPEVRVSIRKNLAPDGHLGNLGFRCAAE
jgi:formylglycine-generating enzyme required for sulfatase activity